MHSIIVPCMLHDCQYHTSWFSHWNNTGWRAQAMSSSFPYVISLTVKYSPQHFVLKNINIHELWAPHSLMSFLLQSSILLSTSFLKTSTSMFSQNDKVSQPNGKNFTPYWKICNGLALFLFVYMAKFWRYPKITESFLVP